VPLRLHLAESTRVSAKLGNVSEKPAHVAEKLRKVAEELGNAGGM